MGGSRAWCVYLLGGAAVLAVFVLLPYGMPRDLLYALIGLSCVTVTLFSAARLRNVAALPWALMGIGQLCAVVGDSLWVYYEHIAEVNPFPSAADGLYLLQYPIVVAALLMLARHHRSPGDREGRLDAAILIVGLSLPYWVLLISPKIGHYDSLLVQVTALGYPLGDVLLLAALVRLLTGSGARTPAFRMIATALVCILAGDVIFVLLEDPQGFSLSLGVLPFLAAYLIWGAAALHPSAADLLRTAPEPAPFLTARRLFTLTTVVLLAPGTLIAQLTFGFEPSAWPVAVASVLLFVLVVARMAIMLRRLEEQARRLDEVARTDTLTGLPNRRTLDAQLTREYGRAARDGTPLALAMVDLDRFKLFNDTHGHQAGDELLAGAATAWSLVITNADMLARYGGEEFVLLMPGRGLEDAEHLLAALRVVTPQGQTFSAGLALWDGRETPLELLRRADTALYAAKEAGRDRAVRAAPPAARAPRFRVPHSVVAPAAGATAPPAASGQ
ncbi:sensor domain-containing diguanylate cyclase [Planomonospora venezuelensis]|uniref:Diguanylate cyclase (GGDEF)-like protein n=1 Tax=Planomonospora venezuelensis TaxID=1999 RepID=A0A841D2N9_PLAVE|nr:GGDEF domain-containing protein [Planomonospora venezuelensis]MBB5964932.1 diguanylate cyclase (GGDEF)-like protein [Planomonospora venezuelensis]